jgi:hypothetical protein
VSDINDLGQIVGVGASCEGLPDGPCGGISSEINIGMGLVAFPFSTANGYGPVAWVAPGSPAGLPIVRTCATDGIGLHISNAEYTIGRALVSPNLGVFVGSLCGTGVTQLYENGIAVIPSGFLYDPFVDSLNARAWVVAPTCSGNEDAYLYVGGPVGPSVSDDGKATICDLVASGFVRNRQENASGQIIVNVGDRAFLYTPVTEAGNLALLGSALTCLAVARRKRAGR